MTTRELLHIVFLIIPLISTSISCVLPVLFVCKNKNLRGRRKPGTFLVRQGGEREQKQGKKSQHSHANLNWHLI